MNLLNYSIPELARGLREKKFTCVNLVQECYDNIESYDSTIHTYITVRDKREVLDEAKQKDKQLRTAQSILYGLPYSIKDAYITKNIRTTCASNVLKNFIPSYNATVNQKLCDAGAILIGKTNQDAWGHGGSSENTDFGPVCNPWDSTRVAGGSSGGSAASISLRMAAFSIGEDTGGSIRNPSAWCNVSGLKVTYGRVSRYGAIAYASSFDTVGPMAKSVEDLSYILEIIAGHDPYDATSSSRTVPKYSQKLQKKSTNITIGWPKEIFENEGLDKEIKKAIETAAIEFKTLTTHRIEIKEIDLPIFDYVIPVAYLIAPSETSSNLARYDSIRYGESRDNFTQETKRRIMIGTYALSAGYYDAYYIQAQKVRTLFIREYTKALSSCDAIIMPVNPMAPPKIGTLINNPLQNYLADIYTYSQNPVGVPSLALPCGFHKNGLPIGMQLVGRMFEEDVILALGNAYQHVTSWHTKKPKRN